MPDSTAFSTSAAVGFNPAENVLQTTGDLDLTLPRTQLRLADGRILFVPTSALQEMEVNPQNEDASPEDTAGQTRIPLFEEQLRITRQTVPTASVRIRKAVETYTAAVDEPLAMRTYSVERVTLNQVVDAAPAVRTEGNTTIYPVLEEQAVVTRQLVLREEIHVTTCDTERRDQQTVTLRRERIEIDRQPFQTDGSSGDPIAR